MAYNLTDALGMLWGGFNLEYGDLENGKISRKSFLRFEKSVFEFNDFYQNMNVESGHKPKSYNSYQLEVEQLFVSLIVRGHSNNAGLCGRHSVT